MTSFNKYHRKKPAWSNDSCPICGRRERRCSVTSDGVWAICYYIFEGAKKVKDGLLGRYGVFLLNAELESQLARFKGSQVNSANLVKKKSLPPAAPVELRDEVYRALLQAWRLSPAHFNSLLNERQLPPLEIERMLYRSPDNSSRVIAPLVTRFGKTLLQVPGFFEEHGKIGFVWQGDLAIPTITYDGKISNLRVRRDNVPRGEKSKRYVYVSSTKRLGPAAVISHHFVPALNATDQKEIWITEGEIKAHILSYRMKVNAVSIPGVGSWRQALVPIEALGVQSATIAIDVDWKTKPEVAQAFHSLAEALKEGGYDVRIAKW